MRNRLLLASGLAAIATVAVAAAVQTVDQKGLKFSVSSLTIKKGTIVRFTNSDTTAHNILIIGQGATVNSGLQQPGGDFRAPFMKGGVYQVTCGIHPKMKLTVLVK